MPAGQKRRGDHAKRLDRLGVPINTGVGVKEITAEGVILSLESGEQKLLRADTIFVVGQPEVRSDPLETFVNLAPSVHALGDATGFGLSKKALKEALEIAYEL